MKLFRFKLLVLFVFTFIYTASIAQPLYDSLFNVAEHKILFIENNSEPLSYINDTAGWNKTRHIKLADIKGKNEILFKQQYTNTRFDNPSLLLIGYTPGFEIYRDSALIYSAKNSDTKNSATSYYDAHFVKLDIPVDSATFLLRIPFTSYLDATGFSSILIGDATDLAKLALTQTRKSIRKGLAHDVMGLFLILTALFALFAFVLRFRKHEYLLLWYFIFAISQGYIFLLENLHHLLNIPPLLYMNSMIVVENLVPIGILGIVACISGYTKNILIRMMIAVHVVYAATSIVMFQYEFFNILFWVLVIIDIILFVYILIISGLYKNKDFRILVFALCALFLLVIIDVFAVFEVFYIADDLSSYGMLLLAIAFAQYIERVLYKSRQKNIQYEVEIQQAKNKLLLLENQRVIAQYEVLKNQVNPHFLFNSLNTLSSLIRNNNKAALTYIEEFSVIYRYVLEANEKTVIELNHEIDFVNSYIYLQQMRYGDNLKLYIETDIVLSNYCVVPLSVQILIENAIKHNQISEQTPLTITMHIGNEWIVVKNPINKLNYQPESNGMGLKNLKARYELITEKECSFAEIDDTFVAKIPVLKFNSTLDFRHET
ncbi:MAG: histidine kinase [Prolixibacteraceae bacterium]|nr:histidine kinase [Prolixibacteraceae bacterium]MBN2650479.1 histidine kinase [Prolixibacteraceae bacterium]